MSHAPFCFVAEKDGAWAGVTAGDYEVKRFYTKFAGYEIKPMATREDWLAYSERVPAVRHNKVKP